MKAASSRTPIRPRQSPAFTAERVSRPRLRGAQPRAQRAARVVDGAVEVDHHDPPLLALADRRGCCGAAGRGGRRRRRGACAPAAPTSRRSSRRACDRPRRAGRRRGRARRAPRAVPISADQNGPGRGPEREAEHVRNGRADDSRARRDVQLVERARRAQVEVARDPAEQPAVLVAAQDRVRRRGAARRSAPRRGRAWARARTAGGARRDRPAAARRAPARRRSRTPARRRRRGAPRSRAERFAPVRASVVASRAGAGSGRRRSPAAITLGTHKLEPRRHHAAASPRCRRSEKSSQ